MTIKTSGSLAMSEINAEFGRGNDLGAYRGVQWFRDDGSGGNFSGGTISMVEFFGKRPDSPVTPGYQGFAPGWTGFVIPSYNYLVIEMWGAGGAGHSNAGGGNPGQQSQVVELGLYAGGGDGGYWYAGGGGGGAGGGNDRNINGNPHYRSGESGWHGGSSPYGGDGGSGGVFYVRPALNGNWPGGGSGSTPRQGRGTARYAGGGGAHVRSVYYGNSLRGQYCSVFVGTGGRNGNDGDGYYNGADGHVAFYWG